MAAEGRPIVARFHGLDGKVLRTEVMPQFREIYEIIVVKKCWCDGIRCRMGHMYKRYFEYWDREGRLYVYREIRRNK